MKEHDHLRKKILCESILNRCLCLSVSPSLSPPLLSSSPSPPPPPSPPLCSGQEKARVGREVQGAEEKRQAGKLHREEEETQRHQRPQEAAQAAILSH